MHMSVDDSGHCDQTGGISHGIGKGNNVAVGIAVAETGTMTHLTDLVSATI